MTTPRAVKLNAKETRSIDRLVSSFEANVRVIDLFRKQLLSALEESKDLAPHVHTFKSRLKKPDHLRDKLERKALEAKLKKVPFAIRPDNLLVEVNDLGGIRILHLYTRQIPAIDKALRGIFKEQRYALVEPPFARTWDDESREFFEACGIKTQKSATLYTSVHYVVGSSSRTPVTCEIQVRTLMEEVWGEVDHAINYPSPSSNLACREQLKVLARVTSSATRLVDSIFRTYEEASGVPTARAPRRVRNKAKSK